MTYFGSAILRVGELEASVLRHRMAPDLVARRGAAALHEVISAIEESSLEVVEHGAHERASPLFPRLGKIVHSWWPCLPAMSAWFAARLRNREVLGQGVVGGDAAEAILRGRASS